MLALALLGIGLYWNINDLRFSSHQWLPKDNPIYQNKLYLDEEFNQGEHLFIMVRLKQNYFDQTLVEALAKIVEQLKTTTFVKQISSPLHASTIIQDHADTLHNTTFKKALESGLISWQEYPDLLRTSYYWSRLIDQTARIIVIKLVLDINADTENSAARRRVVFQAADKIMALSSHFNDYGFAGEAELTHRIDYMSQQNVVTLLPLAALTLLVLLALLYRNAAYVLITLTTTLLALLITFNLNQWLGYSFNVLSASLPVLIITIAVADSIHIVKRWQVNLVSFPDVDIKHNPWPGISSCWQQMWQPCLFTSLTSAIGFGVFYISELIPLSHFGALTFIAILLAYPTIILSTLLMLYILRPTDAGRPNPSNTLMITMVNAVTKQQKNILRAACLLFILAISSTPLMRSETNFLDVFFSHDSATRRTFNSIDDKLSGSGSVDIIIRSNQTDTFKAIDIFEGVQNQVRSVREIAGVRAVSSMLEPINMVHEPLSGKAEELPDTEEGLAQELLFLEFSRSDTATDVLSEFVDFDYQNSRINLYTANMKSSETEDFLARLKPALKELPLSYTLTGSNVYFFELSRYVLNAQFLSILLTSLLVWLLFILQFHFRLGTIGLIASILPIIITLGTQIFLGIPFDFSTVLVASAATGLCIDDTIHYLHRFNIHKEKWPLHQCLQQASIDAWQPIIVTTTVLMGGFVVLLASDLVIIERFSLLLNLALLLSLPATFLLLPAMLYRFSGYQHNT